MIENRYIIYFVPDLSIYTFFDKYLGQPLQRVHHDDYICKCDTLTNAHLVVDALNSEGLI